MPFSRSRAAGAKPSSLGEFLATPGPGRAATTTGPSVRNFVNNVKTLPGAFAEVGKKIGGSLQHLNKKSGGRGRARALNRAIHSARSAATGGPSVSK